MFYIFRTGEMDKIHFHDSVNYFEFISRHIRFKF